MYFKNFLLWSVVFGRGPTKARAQDNNNKVAACPKLIVQCNSFNTEIIFTTKYGQEASRKYSDGINNFTENYFFPHISGENICKNVRKDTDKESALDGDNFDWDRCREEGNEFGTCADFVDEVLEDHVKVESDPTSVPTEAPAAQPSKSPTNTPEPAPTEAPVPKPTEAPAPAPTTEFPSMVPSVAPSKLPTPPPSTETPSALLGNISFTTPPPAPQISSSESASAGFSVESTDFTAIGCTLGILLVGGCYYYNKRDNTPDDNVSSLMEAGRLGVDRDADGPNAHAVANSDTISDNSDTASTTSVSPDGGDDAAAAAVVATAKVAAKAAAVADAAAAADAVATAKAAAKATAETAADVADAVTDYMKSGLEYWFEEYGM